ncbi:hypothetical protein WMY93_004885 [Mugilogobius chulae]|uniref:Uncharacterized protein n=1 Tax=Mugilogobius chulae TaxID=88201 RepID=A0AAW0PSD3_9GOBI
MNELFVTLGWSRCQAPCRCLLPLCPSTACSGASPAAAAAAVSPQQQQQQCLPSSSSSTSPAAAAVPPQKQQHLPSSSSSTSPAAAAAPPQQQQQQHGAVLSALSAAHCLCEDGRQSEGGRQVVLVLCLGEPWICSLMLAQPVLMARGYGRDAASRRQVLMPQARFSRAVKLPIGPTHTHAFSYNRQEKAARCEHHGEVQLLHERGPLQQKHLEDLPCDGDASNVK